MKKIITIGREFGSGGRELGKRIADELNIAYYDREIITKIAEKTDLATEYVQQIIEKKPVINYPITIANSLNTHVSAVNNINATIYAEQKNVLRELASQAPCVIVGRCADYILKDMNPFRIFVYADMPSRMKRCRDKGDADFEVTDKKLKKQIKNIDKHRKHYYEFYTSQKWGDKLNYDICINTSGKTIKEVVAEILEILK